MSLLAVPDFHLRRYRQTAEVLTRQGLRWLREEYHSAGGLFSAETSERR
jgi:hypothetical protein